MPQPTMPQPSPNHAPPHAQHPPSSLAHASPAPPPAAADRKARKHQKRAAKAQAIASKATAAHTPSTSQPASNKPHPNHPRSQPVDVQLSKALAYILRHGALKEGLQIRHDGYVPLDHVLARPKLKCINMAQPGANPRKPDLDDIRNIVNSNDKKRFQLTNEDQVWLVRAVQGHSLKQVTSLSHVRLTLDNLYLLQPNIAFPQDASASGPNDSSLEAQLASTKLEPEQEARPVLVIHGTDTKAWELIRQSGGLRPMTRNHIHLAKGKLGEQGVISGMRKSATRLLFVDIAAAIRDGIAFFLSSNGVVLTPGAVASDTPQEALVPSSSEGNDEAEATKTTTTAAEAAAKGGSQGGQGVLPLRYIVRVEDPKGELVWSA
ncbi:tRNA 2'-phosphotransferase [Thecaphora frezii]